MGNGKGGPFVEGSVGPIPDSSVVLSSCLEERPGGHGKWGFTRDLHAVYEFRGPCPDPLGTV